jgi:hypothetical protein
MAEGQVRRFECRHRLTTDAITPVSCGYRIQRFRQVRLVNRCEYCDPSIPGGFQIERQPHRCQHPNHPFADVMGDHCINVVFSQKPGHSSMMLSRSPFIVHDAPRDLNLLPILDFAIDYVGNCNPIGPTPTVVDLTITRYWHAYDHLVSVPGSRAPAPQAVLKVHPLTWSRAIAQGKGTDSPSTSRGAATARRRAN